jgi:hypothetical protein
LSGWFGVQGNKKQLSFILGKRSAFCAKRHPRISLELCSLFIMMPRFVHSLA